MAQNVNSVKFAILSVLFHVALIAMLASLTIPTAKQTPRNNAKEEAPLKSYLYFDIPPVQPEIQTVADEPLTKAVQESLQQADSAEVNEVTPKPPKQVEAISDIKPNIKIEQNSAALIFPEKPISSSNLRRSAKAFIDQLNSERRQSLSEGAAREYRQPKPIESRTVPLTTNQKRKVLSADFAPPGSNIVVISKSGSDQTNVLVDNKCFTVKKTALDDRITNGASLWVPGNACGNVDKYDGQLKKSLNKFLKNKDDKKP